MNQVTKVINDLEKYKHLGVTLFRGIELLVLKKELAKLKIKGSTLDLGSGDGYINSLLFKAKFAFGVDNNEANDAQIGSQSKRYKKVLIESAEKISLKSNSLGLVFSNSVIEHIPDNKAVLSEVSRLLKKGGLFVFTCPSSFFTKYLSDTFGSNYAILRNKQFNHFHLLSQVEWSKRLKNHGLEVVSFRYYMNRDQLILWELILWLYKLMTPLWFIRHSIIRTFLAKIIRNNLTNIDSISPNEGANILIVAKK